MSICPRYRVRLFLSVDLVGSTAFKDDEHGAGLAADGVSQIWMTHTRSFYRNFPANLGAVYGKAAASVPAHAASPPRVWKTIGDEIVFCCAVLDQDHLRACVAGFVQALADYGQVLVESGGHLDVKGHGWLAVFPTPNVSIAISDRGSTDLDLPGDEEAETACDLAPENFDFLGKHVDAGFRLSAFTRPDRFLMSVELAYLVSGLAAGGTPGKGFGYHGREVMKGVLAGRPYPIVYLDVDPSEGSRDVRSAELAMLGRPEVTRFGVRCFLEKFVEDEGIDIPVLPLRQGTPPPRDWPRSYESYRSSWQRLRSRLDEMIEGEIQGAESAAGQAMSVDPGLPETMGAALRRAQARLAMVGRTRAGRRQGDVGSGTDVRGSAEKGA